MHQETPFFDRDTFLVLNNVAESTIMDERIQRCRVFVQYLNTNEENELMKIRKITKKEFLTHAFMPEIIRRFEINAQWIQGKLSKKGII